MTDRVNDALTISDKLRSLQQKLAQLDAERASVQADIELCMQQLAFASRDAVRPTKVSELILWILRRSGDRALAPSDIAAALDYRSEADYTNVRLHLARLARKKKVRRVAHGRYVSAE